MIPEKTTMTRFNKAAKQILNVTKIKAPARQISAIMVLLAMLAPITAPIPVWAYSLNLPPVIADDGLRLSSPSPSLADSSANIVDSLFKGMATFIAPSGKSDTEPEKGFSKEMLEKKVKGIDTQLADKQEVEKGQILSLAAIPLDKNNSPVNGLAAQWKSSNPEIVKIINGSQAIALKEGEAKLTVSSGKFGWEFVISVLPGMRSSANSKIKSTGESAMMPPPDEPVLSEQQAENLVSPENNLGNPPGQTEMSSASTASAIRTRERHGSSNYSFGIPVASLPGRGIDAGIGITYNSRVWNKSDFGGTRVFDFNTDKNWLAPGFDMGYGEIEGYYTGSGYGYLLSGPDGTRHQLILKQSAGSCGTYESSDGTFIQTTVCGAYNATTMIIKYADGSQVTYGALAQTGKRFPVGIIDRNGNTITITYIQGDMFGKIANIRDTLNRYITFHYDTTPEQKLVAVSVPGFDNATVPRQTIRFYYEDLTLQTAGHFEAPAQVNAPASIKVLRHVYFPGTQTGFQYDYSPYFGMVYKISQRRGMQISENVGNASSLTQTGTITNFGTEAAWTQYNYAAIAMELGPPLTDVPKYSWRKDDWQGRTTTTVPQTSFSTVDDTTLNPQGIPVGTRTTTVTAPDGTKSISVSNIKPPGDWDNGLLGETRLATIETSGEKVWSKTKLYWQQGDNQPTGRDNPRLQKIEITNDAGQIRATSFEYDGYNNQTIVREHDFAAENVLGTELRRTETIYETGAGWLNSRLLRLPKEVKTVVINTAVSKVVYEYDNYTNNALVNTLGVMQHSQKFNPFNPGTHDCNCRLMCDGVEQSSQSAAPTCPDGSPPVRVCDQCPNIPETFRGNVTKVIAFPDTSLPDSDPKNSVSTMKYDITGNVVEAGASCCRLKVWTYDLANGYAYPISETKGDAGQLTTSATYDVPTGLVKSVTDENNQPTTLTYNPSNLRVIRTDSPNGAWATTEYNDSVFPYHVKSTGSLDATRSVSSWSFSNGRGQGFRSRSQTTGGYLSSDVEFDIMGRAVKSYSPYTIAGLNDSRPAGIKFSEVVTRDGLGRTLQSRLPDLTTVNASYNGLVATATDQAGKQRRQIADTLGRTMRVDEPDATGNLGAITSPVQPTYYEYDGNDNLTKVTQTGSGATQERLFKYDSLSRLVAEKQVEATATLNDLGVKVGAGGLWTGVYKYDDESLLLEGVDARGVKTAFTYDGLNRVKTVAYTNETGYQTPNVTYTYDETETGFYNNGRLTKVQTAANATYGTPETIHNYRYDKVGQAVKHIQSIGNQSYQLEYGYNLAGQLVSEKYPSGKIVNMTVDNFGRLSTVADSQRTYLSGITINNQGLLSQMNLGNGTSETFSYNDRFQMTSQSLMKGSEILQKYDYSYGTVNLNDGTVNTLTNNGQLSKIEGFIGANKQWSQRFGYDALGRLSEAREYKQGDNAQLSYKQKFDFDRFGNLYRKAASNPTAGQQNPLAYTPIEDSDISKTTNRFATSTTYDEAGQVVTDNKFRSMGFTYDANGRQVKAVRTNALDAWTVYDALGNRVATKINDVWQYVIYDAFGKLVAEYGVASEGLGGVKYLQQDWQGSVRTTTNSNGFVVARTDHQAFGEDIGYGTGLRSIEQGYSVGKVARQGYGLTENDQGSGQQHTWFRKLETSAGRWTSPDSYKGSMRLFTPQSFNRYSYVINDPVNFADPSGLCLFKIRIRVASNYTNGVFASQNVITAAQGEISRIFTQAGHSVTFDQTARADRTYISNIVTGTSRTTPTAAGDTYGIGTYQGFGHVFGGRLEAMAQGRGLNDEERGIGVGRVAAHEMITHQLLARDNTTGRTGHTNNGLTRAGFGNNLFSSGAANAYNVPADLAKQLDGLCLPTDPQAKAPGTYAGGGGIDSGGSYIGGGGYPWWYYSTWAFANWLRTLGYYSEEPVFVSEEDA
jgi:RHS repeat-associated protein